MESLHHIWIDDDYVYTATVSGLYIYSIDTEEQVSYVKLLENFDCKTVFCDDDYVYIGTATSGIKTLSKDDITIGGNLYLSLTNYVEEPWITSNNTRYLHGNNNNLILCTDIGVDIIHKNSMYVTHTLTSGLPYKCFVTPEHSYFYYTVSGIDGVWNLNRLDSSASDWATPDEIYRTGQGFLSTSSKINDFYVTEHTSMVGMNNTMFVATDAGVFVYDEGIDIFAVYRIQT